MKETGLLFKAPLVRAILSGQKTQTRRIVKPQPTPNHPHDGGTKWIPERGLHVPVGSVGHLSVQEKMGLRCPMGQPGDRIYVRETFNHFERNENFKEGCECFYRADGDCVDLQPWRPAIHMPKHAARIWLEITSVRVERLQQITDTDCWAEGAITEARPDQFSVHSVIATDGKAYLSPRGAFSSLWESTGGDWAADPWVWVIDFKTISTNGRPA